MPARAVVREAPRLLEIAYASGYQSARQQRWVAMITSAPNRGWPGDVPVANLRMAGLPVPSLIRTAKIATIEATDASKLGRLSVRPTGCY